MNYFKKSCLGLINSLLPQRCALCLKTSGSAAPVCGPCLATLPRLPIKSCPRCADYSPSGTLCGHCVISAPAFDRVISPYLYAEPADQLVHALKYGHQLRLAPWLGQQMLQVIADSGLRYNAIVPLPLHAARMKTRGFNQSMEIARPIARMLGIPLLKHAVTRIRDTAPQASLTREDRQHNIRGAFECTTDLAHQSILVIDDVLTTGSSADELARILKIHGAEDVTVATATRTQHLKQ